ncbi:MAG: TOMM precursor leader peptide-binding protein [Pseudomonadota bacterium]
MLRTHLRYGALADDLTLIFGETESLMIGMIDEAHLGLLLSLLDGRRTVRQIIQTLDHRIDVAHIFSALNTLDEQGCLDSIEGDVVPEPGFWHGAGLDLEQVRASLQCASTAVAGCGIEPGLLAKLRDALGQFGVDALPYSDAVSPAFTTVLVDDYLNPDLAAFNRLSLSRGTPWLLAKPIGRFLWFGPLFDPERGACWACLAQRLRDNRRDELAVSAAGTAPTPDAPTTSLYDDASVSILAVQIALLLGGARRDELAESFTTLDHVGLASTRHAFPRRPQCAECGAGDVGASAYLDRTAVSARPGIVLQRHAKNPMANGGHRVCPSEETVARLSPLVSPITGVIPPISDNAVGPFSVAKCKQVTPWRPNSWQRRGDLSLGAGGKGPSSAQARAGCMAEAVERYCGTFQGDEPRISGTLDDLAPIAIHPNSVMGFSDRQYANRATGRQKGFPVPKPFDASMELDWTPVWSLRDEIWRLLPTACCYYESPPPNDFCLSDSNGCAAGNVMVEAVLHALLELIERDALAIWWYNMLCRPPLDHGRLNMFAGEHVAGLSRELAARGRSFALIDLTNDLHVPVIGAVSADETSGEKVVFGFGAHLDVSIAAMRAASELVQLDVYGREAEQSDGRRMAQLRHWFATATLDSHPYLAPDAMALPAAHIDVAEEADLNDDVATLVGLLQDRGHDVLILDATRPDIDFPVVRVVVPGLRHYHMRFASGRLYDVPVAMGWAASPTAEDDLNPIGYFA